MKNLLATFIILLSFSMAVKAQSSRLVLFECFTNACCGPCAAYVPPFNQLVNNNPSKCTSIQYHTNWPGPDPMNAHNPGDVGVRVSLYSIGGVPHIMGDGNGFSGFPTSVTQSIINTLQAVPSPFELTINQRLNATNDTIFVTMMGKVTAPVTGNLLAHCVIIEKHIHYNTAPGSNGEKDFYNVVKKMLPSAGGTKLSKNLQVGDYFILQYSWALKNVINNNELSVVGFIQDEQTKAVHQSATTSTTPITLPFNTDVELLSISNVLPAYCNPTIAPTIKIRNNGTNTITSAVIKYRMNNEDELSYTFNGSLASLQNTNIELPSSSYTNNSVNTLSIYATSVNGIDDEYKRNDTIRGTINKAIDAGVSLKIEIRTDTKPGETTWELKDVQGNLIANGGPYDSPLYKYITSVTLEKSTCYNFTIYDSGNDGICCNYGSGYYRLIGSGTTFFSNTSFTSSETTQFYSTDGVNVDDLNMTSVKIYPNPVYNIATIAFTSQKAEQVQAKVYNMQGKMVINIPQTTYQSGQNEININCSELTAGTYNVQLIIGQQIYNQKITVVR